MMIGDESQRCASCEEMEWQCQCPPEPDEIVNPPYENYYYYESYTFDELEPIVWETPINDHKVF